MVEIMQQDQTEKTTSKETLCECGSSDFLSKSVKAGTWLGSTPFKAQVDFVVTKCRQCRKTIKKNVVKCSKV